MTDKKTVRVGIIGCGAIGQVHLEAYAAIEGVEIVAVADIMADRARDSAAQFGVEHHYGDAAELLEHQLDLVSICTLPGTHRAFAIAALDKGAHVCCEKPMAFSAEEAADMVRAADRNDRLLMIGFTTRFMGASRAVRQFKADGSLGTPIYANGRYLAEDLPWTGKHHVRALSGGGVLSSAAVHAVDLILWLAGSPKPLSVSASMAKTFPGKRSAHAPASAVAEHDVEDIIFGHIRCENFWFSVEGNWADAHQGEQYTFDLIGTNGQAHLDPLELYTERDGKPAAVQSDQDGPDWFGAFAPQMEAVVEAVRTGTMSDILATGRQAMVVQAVVDALYRSAREGKEVAVVIPTLS